jgi:hypothetical protein
MTYQFDIDVASKYGVDSAIMIQNLAFWIKTNASEGRNFYDGRYWTYNSVRSFEKLFPFWSYKIIRRILENLLKSGVLIAGNYNENTYDRTNWYALSDQLIEELSIGSFLGECIRPNGQMEMPKKANGNAQMGACYKETDNKPDNKPDREVNALTFFEINYPSQFEILMMQFKKQINDFVRFAQMFDATVEQEKLEFDLDVLSGRFKKYALNWISNQNKYDNPVIELNPNQKKEKIGGF